MPAATSLRARDAGRRTGPPVYLWCRGDRGDRPRSSRREFLVGSSALRRDQLQLMTTCLADCKLTTTGRGLSAGELLAAGESTHDFFDHRVYVHYSIVQKR